MDDVRRPAHHPATRWLCCAALLLVATACADEDATPAGVRVRILTSKLDGPVEGRLQLRALEEGDDTLYDL